MYSVHCLLLLVYNYRAIIQIIVSIDKCLHINFINGSSKFDLIKLFEHISLYVTLKANLNKLYFYHHNILLTVINM